MADTKPKRSLPDEPDRFESRASQFVTPCDNIQVPAPSEADPCVEQEIYGQEGAATTSSECIVITNIRATAVVLGLQRIPAGFYTIVRHSGLEWRTENKCSSVKDDVVEWSGPIPIPSNPSATVWLEVYASFEFQPGLGTGEQLRQLIVTVKQLLDHSEKHTPFTFFPKDGDVVSPCSSIAVVVDRHNNKSGDSLASRLLDPLPSTINTDELNDATNQGHSALSRYQKHGRKRDLEHSVAQFELALNNCPPNHPCHVAAESNLALAKFVHHQVEGTNAFFEIPLGLYQDVLTTRPVGHADRPSTLIQLAAVHLVRFEKERNEADGAQVKALLHEVAGLRPTDCHENRIAAFMLELYGGLKVRPNEASNQSSVDSASGSHLSDEDPWISSLQLLEHFQRYGDLADLERAVTLLRTLVKNVSDEHWQYCAGLGNLSVALLWRFRRLGELRDLEDSISALQDAIHSTPDDHPDKLAHLNNLGLSFTTRFERTGKLSDLEDAISIHRDAVRLAPDSHPHKPGHLNNLGLSFRARFKRLGELSDLEDAVSTYRDVVRLTPDSHSHKPTFLNNLGLSFKDRFQRLGKLSDLEDAISTHRHAVHLTPDGHPDKPARLNNLGLSFMARFDRLGELSDLEDAISTHRLAVHLTPDGHPDKPSRLNNLGLSFITRFDRLGGLNDLEGAISTHKQAVHLTPDSYPDKPARLTNLGSSFLTRFERLGELSNLEDAISTHRDAVRLTPDSHPDKLRWMNNLGNSLRVRFDWLGELSDLEDAILTHSHVVELAPDGHPDKPRWMNNLGLSFFTRFKRLGKLRDLEDGISTHRDAVHLTPDGHPDKPRWMSNLGSSFITRFERLGEPRDLEDAISTHRDAVRLTPNGHIDKPGRLNNLGNSFRARFECLGELGDLEDAISAHRHAVRLTPDGHSHKPAHLSNLGNSFKTRFDRLGELNDIEDAILTHKYAVHLTPDSHPHKPARLTNLGSSILTRFNHLGELSDLEDAILTHRHAIHLTPDGHPDTSARLNNLGLSFRVRFSHSGELSDLEDAISTHRDAVRLTPDGHPDKPGRLNNLGNSFITRFEHLGELGDLEDAVLTYRRAARLTPDGHPHKPGYLNCLGNSLRTRFDRFGELSDLTNAISLYSHSASFPTGPVRVRSHASRNWISCAQRIHHPSLLHAYSIAISLLSQRAWIGLSLTHRYTELKHSADIVREAAAAALESGFPELAVEWLEQGRSIVWGELLHLRGSYEELSSTHPEHARKFQALSAALDNAGAAREQAEFDLQTLSAALDYVSATDMVLEAPQSTFSHAKESLEHVASTQRTLAVQRDKMLQEIRRLPSFERFLLHKRFSQLRASAHSGPVVMLNAAETRCDALIILPDVDHVIHVPLPNFNIQRSTRLQGILKGFVRHVFVPRDGKSEKWDRGTWESFLAPLWKCIVKPVLDALAFSIPGDLSRIFWCPTGPLVFLPLHAAGFYDREYSVPGHKVFDFVVSSYVPTLSVLAPSRDIHVTPKDDFRLLAVRQPSSDGLSRLPGVHTELDYIKDAINNAPLPPSTILEPSTGTVEEVLGMMKESDWVHFACHGIQDASRPTDSGLCLADGRRLRISDIIGLSRSRGGLAFLSACQTAKGDEDLSDEAVHISAGMLFAGYGGVIGTTWAISDRLAPIVAEDVYAHLFRDGTRPDYREAAWALDKAIRRLRESGEVSFNEWVPFIHVGL